MIKKKTKEKNKILITLCAMFIAIASVFSFVSFNKQDDLVVSADEVDTITTFNGSPILFPYGTNSSSTPNNWSLSDNIKIANFAFSFSYFVDTDNTSYVSNLTFRMVDSVSSDVVYFSSNIFDNIDDRGYWMCTDVGNNNFIHILVTSNTQVFTETDVSFSLKLPVKVQIGYEQAYGEFVNFVRYSDNDGNNLTFKVMCNKTELSSEFISSFRYRDYFLSTSLSDNEIYQQGYNTGSSDAYQPAYNKGYDDGKDNGYDIGYNIGYNNGYTTGAEDTNQYTFLNLVSATIDAPIKYFQSLFNFELLGVNLQGFLTGLFTLCVIVTIIKMVL